jgi:hypothetical protein
MIARPWTGFLKRLIITGGKRRHFAQDYGFAI